MYKISVIIPTYNRFAFLKNALESVKNQTYKNIEIIIVNDCSDQKEYYEYQFKDCMIIHLDKNSKKRFGHASPGGYQRSMGMKIASGDYIAFLDDDDFWLPTKLEKQINEMIKFDCIFSCTDGYLGFGEYNKDENYKRYNREKYFNIIKNIYIRKGKGELMKNGFPKIWNEEFMKVHNCCIASSVMIHKDLIKKIGYFSNDLWASDYKYWLKAIRHTNLVYLDEPLIYFDSNHGDGQNY